MQFRCDKEKRVVLVLGKGLICKQKLQIHLGMRDSSQWHCIAEKPVSLLPWGKLRHSLQLKHGPYQNLKSQPLSKTIMNTALLNFPWCWEYVWDVLCTVWQRLSSSPYCGISNYVAMASSSTSQKLFKKKMIRILSHSHCGIIFLKPPGWSVCELCTTWWIRVEKWLVRDQLQRRILSGGLGA